MEPDACRSLGCGCSPSSDSRPEMHEGTGSNRAGCREVHEPIGEPSDGELRTEGTDTSKAALAREVNLVSKVGESEVVAGPIERYRQDLQERLSHIPLDFDERERFRDEWMTVNNALPEVLCRDVRDMQELLRRATEPIVARTCSSEARQVQRRRER